MLKVVSTVPSELILAKELKEAPAIVLKVPDNKVFPFKSNVKFQTTLFTVPKTSLKYNIGALVPLIFILNLKKLWLLI